MWSAYNNMNYATTHPKLVGVIDLSVPAVLLIATLKCQRTKTRNYNNYIN
jgi:hypothetical protein